MIIGLSGKAGSGKDTVGKFLVTDCCFESMALADPMKDFCKEIFGFTDEQLRGPSSNRNAPDKRYPRPQNRHTFPEQVAGAMWLPLGNQGDFTLIDVGVYPQIAPYSWRLHKKEEGKRTNYVKGSVNGEDIPLHRFLTGHIPEGYVVDHINGDGLDNRRTNLRTCTNAENRQNEIKRRVENASSVFKGVSWDASRNKWSAKIQVAGETRNLGRFTEEQHAALAYDNAAREAFGAFARTNTDAFLTPRHALQQLGTEFGRACYQDVWVEYAMRKARERLAFYRSDGVVITDVRFKSERDAIWKAGGRVWRIVRNTGLVGVAGEHISETELTDEMPYDRVIDNKDGPLEDLRALVVRAIGGKP